MLKLAIAGSMGLVHGYMRVDATGVRLTRRPDFREKGELPRWVLDKLVLFDAIKKIGLDPLDYINPFEFDLYLTPYARVEPKATEARKKQINDARKARKARGEPDKQYFMRARVDGLHIGRQLAAQIRRVERDAERAA